MTPASPAHRISPRLTPIIDQDRTPRLETRSMIALARRILMLGVAVAAVAIPSVAPAQTVSTFLGGSGADATAQQSWTTAGNWNTGLVPSGTGAWAQINSSTTPILRILYTSTAFNGGVSGTALSVGAISFLPTLANTSGTYGVQNNSVGTRGTLRLYGIDTTVDGTSSRFILINSSTLTNVTFTQSLAGQDFELYTSGAVHVTAGTQLTLTPVIRDGTGSRSVTKTGAGVLALTGSSEFNTYAGGFALSGGVVQWANSGVAGVNTPFGLGSLALRSGTLRSTSATGRSINSSVVLDGAVTLGSTDSGFTGNITVNSSGGSLATTITSDSIVTIVAGGSTAWNQATSGAGGLTKAGTGILRFTGAGGDLTHTGSTVVQSGTLMMNANLSSASVVSVLSGATLLGSGTIAGAATVQPGGILAPGSAAATPGILTFGSSLGLGGQTLLELTGTARGSQYDGLSIAGPLTYGGSLLLQFSGTLPDGTYDLFSGFSSQAGTFSAITAAGGYAGSLSESAGVWTGTFGAQTLTFTNATGSLVIVPEPSAAVLVSIVATLGIHRLCRRRRDPMS
jgi:autotransporter-associated beta strand protein